MSNHNHTREQLASMSPEQINTARHAGHLDQLLRGEKPRSAKPKQQRRIKPLTLEDLNHKTTRRGSRHNNLAAAPTHHSGAHRDTIPPGGTPQPGGDSDRGGEDFSARRSLYPVSTIERWSK